MKSTFHFKNAGLISLIPMLAAHLLTAPPTANADQVKLVARSNQGLVSFATLIDGAQSSIDIATFIFEPCAPGVRVMVDRLTRKAKAGVKIRILLDAFRQSPEQKRNLAATFSESGIELRWYNNSILDINTRLHSKSMIIDGRAFILGGRNFGDEYFGLSPDHNYMDRDALVTGPSAKQVESGFLKLWNSDMASVAAGDPSEFVPWNSFCPGGENPSRIRKIENYIAKHGAEVFSSMPEHSCSNIRYSVDDPDFASAQYGATWDNGAGARTFLSKKRLARKGSTQLVLQFILGTKRDLYMENESYMPISKLEAALTKVRNKGIPVSILANRDTDEGPDFFKEAESYETAKIAAQDSVAPEWVGLVASAGSLTSAFELTPAAPYFIHQKVGVRDGKDVFVGSFNLDSRSENINIESALIFKDCEGLADDVKSNYDETKHYYDEDLTSGTVPPSPDPSPLAIWFGDVFLYQL